MYVGDTEGQRRGTWGRGPWDDEPDRIQGETDGVMWLVLRAPFPGTLNGYVAVKPGHPWHGRDPWQLTAVEVYGGITYADCDPITWERVAGATAIGHLPLAQQRADCWWVGFDCGHLMSDVIPLLEDIADLPGTTYKDVAYVRAEVMRLVAQARAVGA